MGKEQEQIQETKLRALTLQNLQQGATQTIARAKDDAELKRSRGNDYPPGPPPPPQPGMMRRIINSGTQQVGNTIQWGMKAFDDFAERQAERAQEHREYLEHQQWAMDNEDRFLRAQKEQADQERMSWHSTHSNAASSQSLAILNGPASTVYHYVGHDDEDDGPELSSGGASSSGGGWFSQGMAAINASHQAAIDRAEEHKKKKKKTKSPNYQQQSKDFEDNGPDPGGGGGYGEYNAQKQARKSSRQLLRLFNNI
jgi:hypothetical protein